MRTRRAVLLLACWAGGVAAAQETPIAERLLADRELFSEKNVAAVQKAVERRQVDLVKAAGREKGDDGSVQVYVTESILAGLSAAVELSGRDKHEIGRIREKYGAPDKVVRNEFFWLGEGSPVHVTAYYYGDLVLGVRQEGARLDQVELIRLRAGKVYPKVYEVLAKNEVLAKFPSQKVATPMSLR